MEEIFNNLTILRKQEETNKRHRDLRISELGKPPLLQALRKLGYVHDTAPCLKMQHLFWTGQVNEEMVVQMLRDNGHVVSHEQLEVNYQDIKGHIDFIVDGRYLVDVKTMCDSYFRSFLKAPDDFRGYLTQLSAYRAAAGMPEVESAWFWCINKDTSVMAMVRLEPQEQAEVLRRVDTYLDKLKACTTLTEAVEWFAPPPPRAEIYQKSKTGKLLPPFSMVLHGIADAFWVLKTEHNNYRALTNYIVSSRTPAETIALLQARFGEIPSPSEQFNSAPLAFAAN